MSFYIPRELRLTVIARAKGHCEYCQLAEVDSYTTFQIDHIISLKHGGETNLDNLALACLFCNRNKGSDVGTVLLPDRTFTRLFDPMLDAWTDHFVWEELTARPLTIIGEATTKVLAINDLERIMERQILSMSGRFPPNIF